MKKKISEKNIRGLVLTLKPDNAQKLLLDKKNEFKEDIDFANAAFWILKNYVNTTGSNAEILRWPRFYVEV